MLTPVRLVHQGSGFIVEGTLSDAGDTRFVVPYPGEWDIFMTAPPQFAPDEMIEYIKKEREVAAKVYKIKTK